MARWKLYPRESAEIGAESLQRWMNTGVMQIQKNVPDSFLGKKAKKNVQTGGRADFWRPVQIRREGGTTKKREDHLKKWGKLKSKAHFKSRKEKCKCLNEESDGNKREQVRLSARSAWREACEGEPDHKRTNKSAAERKRSEKITKF